MDKDRVVGAAKQLKGKIREEVGKAVGDAKLETEGKADRIEGEIQNALGGLKDAIKRKLVAPADLGQRLNRLFLSWTRPGTIQDGASKVLHRIGGLFPDATPEYAQFELSAIPVTKTEASK